MVTHHRMVEMIGIVVGKNDGGIIFNAIKHPSIVIFLHNSPFRSGFIGSGCFQFDTQSGENKSGRFTDYIIIQSATDVNQKL
jgi:hypothetical protein